ncbi:GCN5-related N-acetyltransferase [Oscillochloris trichoides DG-6]|uniref:GCN5-related N-acetyltransferase n=1 Tax=Oscillochloris trichoides DG-6 TaxID=765420 RepID=E1I9Z5_9CHLR|nr:GNAT family N-acetyltransferase [Oscillochloris trichoides]EFO81997.1 GCN5-related N-acetyltransferase [Oscillochloris trichoides DG-6]
MTSHALVRNSNLLAAPLAGPTIALRIRPAYLDDVPAILALHRTAFADTFGGAFGHAQMDRGVQALATTWQRQGDAAMRGMLVAEHEGHLIGTTTMRTCEMGNYDAAIAEAVFQEVLGSWGAMRSMFALSLLDHQIDHHEGFLTDVAVVEGYRRSGVARSLLIRAEEEARARHKRFLGLYVSARNTSAINLYHQLGFVHATTRHSFFAWLFFGQGTWYYMRKSLL